VTGSLALRDAVRPIGDKAAWRNRRGLRAAAVVQVDSRDDEAETKTEKSVQA